MKNYAWAIWRPPEAAGPLDKTALAACRWRRTQCERGFRRCKPMLYCSSY